MRAEQTGALEPVGDSRPPKSLTAVPPLQQEKGGRAMRNRVQCLLELAYSLLSEAQTLARDSAFAEQSNRLQVLNLSEGIDFYDEVKRFETDLIKLALDQTAGHQARAARLLHIKPTTLSSKIKLYGIEF